MPLPAYQDPRRWSNYTGTFGGGAYSPTNPAFPPTAKAPPYPSTSLEPAIQGLITPGLVPDIARMSAETTAGRGIAGSPAADSTAVKMSEQNYLQRLALANQLLSGESDRTLPYQITPYQSAGLQTTRDIAGMRWGGGGQTTAAGGGGRAAPQSTPWAGFMPGQHPAFEAVGGTRPPGTESSPFMPQAGGYGGGSSLWGDAGVGGMLGGAGGGNLSLDDIYEELGFGDFGSLPGDMGEEIGPEWDL